MDEDRVVSVLRFPLVECFPKLHYFTGHYFIIYMVKRKVIIWSGLFYSAKQLSSASKGFFQIFIKSKYCSVISWRHSVIIISVAHHSVDTFLLIDWLIQPIFTHYMLCHPM